MTEVYRYTTLPPVGWTRVLEVLPGTGPLQCSLRAVEFNNPNVSFEAISYVWGPDPTIYRADITCDGRIHNVGANLARALRRIRDPNKSRIIWADAICINQKDNDERSLQVQQMGDIYSKARKVLICVDDNYQEEAVICFNLIAKVNTLSRQLRVQYGANENIPAGAYDIELASIPREAWDTVRQLMEASWFSRVWAIQEVGVARSACLLYGSSEMNWTELVEFMMCVVDRPDLAMYAVNVNAGMIWDVFEGIWSTFTNTESWRNELSYMESIAESASKQGFLDIVNIARYHQSTDPRDHIYAFLGHPTALQNSSSTTKIIKADYNKSVIEVYTALATYTIVHGPFSWTTLSSVDHTDDTPALKGQRPSWVPWWNEGWRVYWLGYQTMWYRAGGLDPDQFRAKVLPNNNLHLNAIVFDEISFVSEHLTKEILTSKRHTSADPIKRLWTVLREASGPSRYGDAGQSEIAFSLVTVAGRARDEGPAEDDMALHTMTYNSTLTTHSPQSDTGENSDKTVDLHTGSFMHNQVRGLHNRKLFRTRTGYYGACHFAVGPGDFCAVIPGANVPFVLRKTVQSTIGSASQNRYRLIGEAYIQGVMKGELVSEQPEENLVSGEVVQQEIVIL